MNQELISIFEKEIGSKATPTSKGNLSFYSPFTKHEKRKLEVGFDGNRSSFGRWHCWVSDRRGRDFISLLQQVNASKASLDRAKEILKESKYRYMVVEHTDEEKSKFIHLPEEFKSLSETSRWPDYKHALHYVKNKRGLTDYDILKYNIGYCRDGKYSGYIIIPSYNEDGVLNYFVTRTFYDSKYKHKNPPLERDIIGFDNLVNWNEPLVLVEGAFDAISARINAIPLFGKVVLEKLKIKIIKNKVQDIYIGLDTDAIRNSLKLAEYFMSSGINIYLMDLGDEDPNEMGYKKFRQIMNNTEKLTFSRILKYKLEYGI